MISYQLLCQSCQLAALVIEPALCLVRLPILVSRLDGAIEVPGILLFGVIRGISVQLGGVPQHLAPAFSVVKLPLVKPLRNLVGELR